MFTLSGILKINAISSGVTGLILVAFSNFIATLFEVDTRAPFLSVGWFLIAFSLFVFYQAYQKPIRPRQVVSVIWMDRIWVIASFMVIPFLYSSVSLAGVVIILAIAAWVGLMAYLQNAKLISI